MRSRLVLAVLACSSTIACGALLSLPDAVLDDNVGKDGGATPDGAAMDTQPPPPDTSVMDVTTADVPLDVAPDVAKVPIALTSGNRPWGLAIDDTYVYWSEPFNYVIGRVKKDGTGATQLATGASYAFGVHWIATDGTDVFWAEFTDIYKCARNGCNNAPTSLATLTNSAYVVAVDANNVYFGEDVNGGIYKVPKSGGAETKIATVSNPVLAMFVDGSNLIATLQKGSVVKIPIPNGGNVTVLAPQGTKDALGLALGGGFAYYGIFDDPAPINVTSISNGMPKPLSLNHRFPFGLTVDMSDLYWVDTVTLGPTGELWKCSLAMCSATKIATGLDTPKWMANDQTAVYWAEVGNANNSGGVYKLLK